MDLLTLGQRSAVSFVIELKLRDQENMFPVSSLVEEVVLEHLQTNIACLTEKAIIVHCLSTEILKHEWISIMNTKLYYNLFPK